MKENEVTEETIVRKQKARQIHCDKPTRLVYYVCTSRQAGCNPAKNLRSSTRIGVLQMREAEENRFSSFLA